MNTVELIDACHELRKTLGMEYVQIIHIVSISRYGKIEESAQAYHKSAMWGEALPTVAEAVASCIDNAPRIVADGIASKQRDIEALKATQTLLLSAK
jgi:hypothetical protein